MARKSSRKSRKSSRKSHKRPTGKYTAGRSRSFYAGPRDVFEKKFLDLATQVTTVTSGGSVNANYFGCRQGNSPITRIGNKITVTNINMRGLISSGSKNDDATVANECPAFRIIIGIDKQCNGAVPAIFAADHTGILQGIVTNTYADCLAYRNMYNLDRFIILKDKLICSRTGGYGNAAAVKIDTHIPFKFSWKGMLPVMYNADTGNITDVRSNNLFVAVIADKNATTATSTNPTCEWMTRIKYIDA